MRIACWITKSTHTHTNTNSQYVIIIALPLQQYLQERVSLLRYMYMGCMVMFLGDEQRPTTEKQTDE